MEDLALILDANDREFRYFDTHHSKVGDIADVSGVLRNDIIIRALRAAGEPEFSEKAFLPKRKSFLSKAA